MRGYIAILLLSYSVMGYTFDFEGGHISIPQNFEGPITKNMGSQGTAYAFGRKHSDGKTATLLQLSVFNPGQKFPSLSQKELKEAAAHYLIEILRGVERRRTNFQKSKISYIQISGIPAAKIYWSGSASSRKIEGVMYCYIRNSDVISLHTQDFKEYKGKYISQAVNAFESIRINR